MNCFWPIQVLLRHILQSSISTHWLLEYEAYFRKFANQIRFASWKLFFFIGRLTALQYYKISTTKMMPLENGGLLNH
jgi:hypothetical protein